MPSSSSASTTAMTAAQALKQHKSSLTTFEQSEILSYKQIYYCGQNCAKKIKGVKNAPYNDGYDDKDGTYLMCKHDHLEYRYEIFGDLGSGSFGTVVQAYDYKKNDTVAVKIIRNARRFHKQGKIEVQMLKKLIHTEGYEKSNMVRVYGYFMFRNHLCITFEKLSYNLYELIRKNRFQGFNSDFCRRIGVQILQALTFLKKQKVIHCDLKPENVLMREPTRSAIRVIDLGSACWESELMHSYVQSRFYRSPEVILELKYSTAVDMWSFGCVLCELYTGIPIFPGENEHDQLSYMMQVLDLPPYKMIDASPRRKTFFVNHEPIPWKNSKGESRGVGTLPLLSALRTRNLAFVRFVEKCLRWNPEERITPAEALADEWIMGVTTRNSSWDEQKNSEEGDMAVSKSSNKDDCSSRNTQTRNGAMHHVRSSEETDDEKSSTRSAAPTSLLSSAIRE